jgi:hypothetical protein
MDFKEFLNTFIEEAVLEDYPIEMSVSLLFSESTRSLHDGSTVLEMLREDGDLTETVKRTRIKVAGGGFYTKRKIGRPNPRRSQIAKRAAMKGKSKRKIAARSMKSKIKRRRTLKARKSLMGGGAKRGAHGAKRHAGPRRAARPKIRRPKVRRPKVRRPTMRRPKIRRPSYRRPVRRR